MREEWSNAPPSARGGYRFGLLPVLSAGAAAQLGCAEKGAGRGGQRLNCAAQIRLQSSCWGPCTAWGADAGRLVLQVITDPITGRSKGYGFVRFGNEGERDRSLNEMMGHYIASRPIRVSLATAKKNPGGLQARLFMVSSRSG